MTVALVLGLLTGLTYALLATGLVLVWKVSGFVSLTQAQFGVVGAMLLPVLVGRGGWSYPFAALLALASGVSLAVCTERFLVRRVRDQHGLAPVLLSLGVAQVLLAATYLRVLQPDRAALNLQGYPVPFQVRWELGGVVLRGEQALLLLVVPLLGLGLAAFLRGTATGQAVRAVAADAEEASLCGISPGRVRAVVWGIAGGLSAVAAILVAPSQSTFNLPALGPDLLVRTLGSAAIGGLGSLRWTACGGVLLGLVEQVALAETGRGSAANLAVLATVVLALVLRAGSFGRFVPSRAGQPVGQVAAAVSPAAPTWAVRRQWQILGGAGLLLAVVAPLLPGLQADSKRFLLCLLVVYALLAVSVTVLMGWAGQLCLGHFALLGVGAWLTAALDGRGWSLPVVLLLAGLAGALVMVALGLPAVRGPSVAVAVTTLAFATSVRYGLLSGYGGDPAATVTARPPGVAGLGRPSSSLQLYYVALGVLALTLSSLSALRRSTPGRLVLAARDNPRDVLTLGQRPTRVTLSVLAVSGFVAAAAGVLWISAWHTVSAELLAPEASLALLAAPVIGGLGSLAGAVAGTVYVYAPELFLSGSLRDVFGRSVATSLLLSGVGLVVVQLWFPGGVARAAQRFWLRWAVSRRRPGPVSAVEHG